MAAEIISGIVQTLITKLGEQLAREIKNQFTLMCCPHFYVQRLYEEVQKLETERQMIQQKVILARRNLDSIRPDVIDWLTKVDNWMISSHKILDKADHHRYGTSSKSFFLKWLPMVHYSLSVEAQNAIDASVHLQITPGKFDRVYDLFEIQLESRASLEKRVMDALEDDAVYLIHLFGMVGVGKTTLVTKMKNWAKSSNMFKVVIFIFISQRLHIKEVQQQIANGLGLTLEEHSLHMRAEKIHARLSDEKSFLIIFDNVSKPLDLQELGIPSKSTIKKYKLIITSRIEVTLTTSSTYASYKKFNVDILPDEEAWKLFQEKAGDSIEAPELVEIAKEIAEQCKGLPIALVVVGSALKDKSKSMWVDALIQLKMSNVPTDIPESIQVIYVSLKWSYEQLPSEEARYIFLLCCLFPEDAEIPTEMLVRYGWGLHIFNDVETMRQARDRVSFLVDILKCRFLLIQAKSESFFGTGESMKVHHPIRDVGILIACEHRYVFMVSQGNWPRETSYENITHIYVELNGKLDLPETINCPALEFLHIQLYSDFGEDIPEKLFSSMKGLKVLSACMFKTKQIPSSIPKLTNLRAIYLEDCLLGKMESFFENMVNLEIISLRGSSLEVLPREIGHLQYLRALDLTNCEIISIDFGVISELVKLEELLMVGFEFLKEQEEEKEMMVLANIGSLSNLANLQIKLSNPKIFSLDQPFLPKLERFVLLVAGHGQHLSFGDIEDYALYNKVALISYMGEVPIKNFILPMIRNAEGMRIEGDCCIRILNELANVKFQELKLLSLAESKNLEYLVVRTTTYQSQSQPHRGPDKIGVLFPTPESLCPECGENLEEICFHQPYIGSLRELHLEKMDGLKQALTEGYFNGLEVFKIFYCKKLKNVMAPSVSRSLKNLKRLCIEDCEELEEVIMPDKDQEVQTNMKETLFPRLQKLELLELPMMYTFCHIIPDLEFPSLEVVSIQGCPLLKTFSLGFPSFPKIKVLNVQDPGLLLSEFNIEVLTLSSDLNFV